MKLATGLDEMPGRRGIPEVNWRRWSSLWPPSGRIIQEKERAGREWEEKKGWAGKGLVKPLPRGLTEKGLSLNNKSLKLTMPFLAKN